MNEILQQCVATGNWTFDQNE